jgi:hypothetical protein
MSGTALVQYEAARQALAECVRVDEAKDWRDRAAALAAYARQRDDKAMETWVSEIHKRACIRIGQLSRELETAEHEGPGAVIPSSGKYKRDALADAGISTTTANRYEQLAGGKTERGQNAAEAAAESYFARSREDSEPPTMDGLRGAIRDALVETLGEPPERNKVVSFRGRPDPTATAETDMGTAIHIIAELPEPDMSKLAGMVHPGLIDWQLERAGRALTRLDQFITALHGRNTDAA